jgi:hypothetical protein
LLQALRACYVPPTGFGYPHGDLLPPRPGRLFFTPAALLGFALRSFLLPKGVDRVSAETGPHAVCSHRFSRPDGSGWAGPVGRGFWASTLSRVPGDRCRVGAAPAGCSLGLCPLRAFRRQPTRDFARAPPTRFATVGLATDDDRRLGVSIGSRLASSVRAG